MAPIRRSLDRSARATVKKNVPPSTLARRYRDIVECYRVFRACAWSLRVRTRGHGAPEPHLMLMAPRNAPLPTLREQWRHAPRSLQVIDQAGLEQHRGGLQ